MATESDLPEDCFKLSRVAIRKAIKQLKSEEAAGPDQIPAEELKVYPETLSGIFYGLFGNEKRSLQMGRKACHQHLQETRLQLTFR